MAKQSFTTGQVLTASQMTSLQQTALLGGAASAKVASYTLVAADAGTAISMTNASSTTITVNTGLFASGDIVTIVNLGAGTCTITAGTATINTSANLALGQYEGGVLYFTSASAAIFFEFSSTSTGDITAVTTAATSGLAGGATTGAVALTLATAAKGDLLVGTGANTASILSVGANNTVLTADSTTSTGLKFAAAASGGMTLLSTTTLSGTTTSITGISGAHNDLQIIIKGFDKAGAVRLNGSSNTYQGVEQFMTTTTISTTGKNNVELRLNAGDGVSASNTGAIAIYVRDYANTTSFKVAGSFGSFVGTSHNTTFTYFGQQKTTSAITSVDIVSDGGSFGAGTVLIYGVK